MKPLILISNDDGLYAKGLHALVNFTQKIGEVYVVVPDAPRSGTGHAVTIHNPLRYVSIDQNYLGCKTYVTNGTPVDCVKLALFHILPERPSLILSGINHGSNASINVLYSGTMAAAIEGSLHGISSIGLSHVSFDQNTNFAPLEPFIEKLLWWVLEHPLPYGISLNVNFPSTTKIKGYRWCSLTPGYWEEEFEERIDTHQQTYFWLKGDFKIKEQIASGDIKALEEGYITIVPITTDMTAFSYLEIIKNLTEL